MKLTYQNPHQNSSHPRRFLGDGSCEMVFNGNPALYCQLDPVISGNTRPQVSQKGWLLRIVLRTEGNLSDEVKGFQFHEGSPPGKDHISPIPSPALFFLSMIFRTSRNRWDVDDSWDPGGFSVFLWPSLPLSFESLLDRTTEDIWYLWKQIVNLPRTL